VDLPELVWRAHALWAATRNLVVGGLVGGPDGASPGQAVEVKQTGNGAQAPAYGSYGGNQPAPACQHGQRVWREAKPGSGKSWKGWFCPAPQGTPDQCKPQFVN
jgi:hypothetical protein